MRSRKYKYTSTRITWSTGLLSRVLVTRCYFGNRHDSRDDYCRRRLRHEAHGTSQASSCRMVESPRFRRVHLFWLKGLTQSKLRRRRFAEFTMAGITSRCCLMDQNAPGNRPMTPLLRLSALMVRTRDWACITPPPVSTEKGPSVESFDIR